MPNCSNKSQKIMKFGVEFEFFTLDESGYMANGSDRLIQRVKKKYPEVYIKRECGKNMVEITTPPNIEIPNATLKAIEDLEKVIECAREENLILYSYGTYPGSFTPEFHSDKRYKAQEKIFGKQRFLINGRCIGLHIHYSLPWGVFDSLKKIIKPMLRSKNAESLVHIYNFCIAMDPAITALTQSSPFYQGKFLAKDSRMVIYRGGQTLNYPEGVFANHPEFGALQDYKSTNTDIIHAIAERFENWSEIVQKIGYNIYSLAKHGSIMDSAWNPVKINAHGTIEIRGMDMNHPDIIVAAAILIKFILKTIQEKFVLVKPSDFGKSSPFKYDGKTILIPPSTYVRNELQYLSAYEGLANDTVCKYCSALVQLAKNFIPEKKQFLLKPFDDMLSARQTASDRIIKAVEYAGWDKEKLTPKEAATLALELSLNLYDEIAIIKERLIKFLDN